MQMNRDGVRDMAGALHKRTDLPNLRAGALTLERLMEYVDSHSDGWPYWSAPSLASKRLQEALEKAVDLNFSGYMMNDPEDITDAELKGLLTPIKSFLTKRQIDHDEVLWLPERDNRQRTFAQVVVNLYLPHDLTRLPAEQVAKIQAGIDSLADVMHVQDEDGIYLFGSKEAVGGEIDGVEVENEFVCEIERSEVHVAYGTYEVAG